MKKGKDSVFCSLSDRAYTDIITNITNFAKLDLNVNFSNLFKRGGFPLESLPSVLHETVHHWCFMTPFGSVTTLLKIRSYASCLRWGFAENDMIAEIHDSNVLFDHLRYTALNEIMRPLNEGMAMFAEHDVMPYHSTPVISKPLEWVYFLYCPDHDSDLENDSHGKSLVELLGRWRSSSENIRRKTELLVQPLDLSKGGYLPGYLSIKSLWLAAIQKCHLFTDSDLFYSFLRRYIYSDYGLIEVILDDKEGLAPWLEKVTTYLLNRWMNFTNLDLEKEISIYIDNTLEKQKPTYGDGFKRLSQSPPIGTSKKQHDNGYRLFTELVSHVNEEIAISEKHPDANIGLMVKIPMAIRNLLWIGEMKVKAKINNGSLAVYYKKELLFETELMEDGITLSNNITANYYISTFESFIGVSVHSDRTLIAVKIYGEIEEPVRNEFKEQVRQGKARAEWAQNMFNKLFEKYREMHGSKSTLEDFPRLTRLFSEKIYRTATMAWVLPGTGDACWEKMQKSGLYSLLDNNLILVKKIAALSIAASLGAYPEEANDIPSLEEENIFDLLEELRLKSDETGFALIAGQRGKMMGSYV